MRNLKSSNEWSDLGEWESEPAHGVLHKNFEKLGKYSSKTKYAHTLGKSETTVKWEPKKEEGSEPKVCEGTMNLAWKNTVKGHNNNPLMVEVTNKSVLAHQDLGKHQVGGGKFTINPFVAYTVDSKSLWNWWSYSTRVGHITQWTMGGWDVLASENCNWESTKDRTGPGKYTWNCYHSFKRDENELALNQTMDCEPNTGLNSQTRLSYLRRDKNWSLFLQGKWLGLNPLGQDSVLSMATTWKACSQATLAASAEVQIDPSSDDSRELDGNVHLGGTWSPCHRMNLTAKVQALRKNHDLSWLLGFHMHNKWCKPFETHFVVQADVSDLKNPQWGLNVSNNF